MSAATEYARSRATPDVRATLDWLERDGFTVTHERGGLGESFGNVLLEFERADVRVQIVRDRGQWMISVRPAGVCEFKSLNVLITAMRGDEPQPGQGSLGETLPEQLPVGARWAADVPQVVEWLAETDRSPEISDADSRWRDAMRGYWREEDNQLRL